MDSTVSCHSLSLAPFPPFRKRPCLVSQAKAKLKEWSCDQYDPQLPTCRHDVPRASVTCRAEDGTGNKTTTYETCESESVSKWSRLSARSPNSPLSRSPSYHWPVSILIWGMSDEFDAHSCSLGFSMHQLEPSNSSIEFDMSRTYLPSLATKAGVRGYTSDIFVACLVIMLRAILDRPGADCVIPHRRVDA